MEPGDFAATGLPMSAAALNSAIEQSFLMACSFFYAHASRRAFTPSHILDLGLPDGDGIRLLSELRSSGNLIPVVVLTAREAVEDRVSGLNAGADAYLVKPFAMTEIIARTKALLRRPGGALGATLKAGNITFDTIGRDISVNDTSVLLPRRESAILEHLMRRLGRVVPKSVLEEKLYGLDDELESNAIPVHIHHLRRKLVDAGAAAEIHTVRGLGYLLTETKG